MPPSKTRGFRLQDTKKFLARKTQEGERRPPEGHIFDAGNGFLLTINNRTAAENAGQFLIRGRLSTAFFESPRPQI